MPCVLLLSPVPSLSRSPLLHHRSARSEHARAPDKSQPSPRLWKTGSVLPHGTLHCWGFWLLLSSWASPGRTVWPQLEALSESCCGRPDLWLCYYCVLEFSQPRAPWRIPELSLGRISQTMEEISKMLGTSCVTVSPRPPGTGGLLFAARGRRKLIKGRSWGEAGSRHLCACVVLPRDNVPSFLTKTVITEGPLMCSQCSRWREPLLISLSLAQGRLLTPQGAIALASGVRQSFAHIENKAPLSCLCPSPTAQALSQNPLGCGSLGKIRPQF